MALMVKSRRILPQTAGEPDLVRVAGIGGTPVYAVGGDFQGQALQEDRYRTMLFANIQGAIAGKRRPDLLGQRGRGQIVVRGGPAQKEVPDTAAHDPRLVACPLQNVQGFFRLGS